VKRSDEAIQPSPGMDLDDFASLAVAAGPQGGAMFASLLACAVERYVAEVADETDDLTLLRARLAAGDALDRRTTYPGHVTTSAIVVDPSVSTVLLVRHRALGRWLQPGGHFEPADSLLASAAREAQEETGLTKLRLHPWHGEADLPIDIDTHPIPANPRKGEPDHFHFDIRYVFAAPADSVPSGEEAEVTAVAWRPLSDLAAICPRVHRRLVAKPRA
jgi:8-oxo-dGTP pyrophosphatase MutT (NUDIX family)